jgi:enamine deaminase RidA (YjgF/YER057c/UK114 family)
MPHSFLKAHVVAEMLFCAGMFLAAAAPSPAQVVRVPLPNNDPFPIAGGVWVGSTLYLSGTTSPSADGPTPGNTEAQTVGAIKAIESALKGQKLTLGDVVLMHVYLAADPAKGGKMDFAGFMAGYSQFFGTKDQPNKPARSTMQVAALVEDTALVEIEVVAVRPR